MKSKKNHKRTCILRTADGFERRLPLGIMAPVMRLPVMIPNGIFARDFHLDPKTIDRASPVYIEREFWVAQALERRREGIV